jgi:hypothetical protein
MRGLYPGCHRADTLLVASGTSLRHLRPSRFRRSRTRASADELALQVAHLVAERQQLREREASQAALERNRIQIARAQWELGHALIDRHLPVQSTAA